MSRRRLPSNRSTAEIGVGGVSYIRVIIKPAPRGLVVV